MQESGRRAWNDGFNDTEREKEYVQMKESPRNESFVDGSVGARDRLMVRGGCSRCECTTIINYIILLFTPTEKKESNVLLEH